MPDTTALRFQDVSQRFRIIRERSDTLREAFTRVFRLRHHQAEDFYALKHVSFSVSRGESLGIIGRNGSGKTTTLKIAAGIYKPTTGSVELNGRISALTELGSGFHPELTGRENIILSGVLLGLSRREIEQHYQRIVEFAELEEFINTPIKQYSSGMLARLGFAVATEWEPEILLVDEILAVGDAPFQLKSFERMNRFRTSGCTIVLVSHDLAKVEEFCDRVLVLDNGNLITDAPPAAAIARYREICEHPAPHPAEIRQ
jgi:lipopolysaccharide transport system ATP-binding protein